MKKVIYSLCAAITVIFLIFGIKYTYAFNRVASCTVQDILSETALLANSIENDFSANPIPEEIFINRSLGFPPEIYANRLLSELEIYANMYRKNPPNLTNIAEDAHILIQTVKYSTDPRSGIELLKELNGIIKLYKSDNSEHTRKYFIEKDREILENSNYQEIHDKISRYIHN